MIKDILNLGLKKNFKSKLSKIKSISGENFFNFSSSERTIDLERNKKIDYVLKHKSFVNFD